MVHVYILAYLRSLSAIGIFLRNSCLAPALGPCSVLLLLCACTARSSPVVGVRGDFLAPARKTAMMVLQASVMVGVRMFQLSLFLLFDSSLLVSLLA